MIVDELGLLIGPAIIVVNNSTEVYVRQKTQRSFWSYGAVGKSGTTDGQSQKKFVNERHTATSRQKRQRVNICCEISTLALFISINCVLAAIAFPHVETVKYEKVQAFVMLYVL